MELTQLLDEYEIPPAEIFTNHELLSLVNFLLIDVPMSAISTNTNGKNAKSNWFLPFVTELYHYLRRIPPKRKSLAIQKEVASIYKKEKLHNYDDGQRVLRKYRDMASKYPEEKKPKKVENMKNRKPSKYLKWKMDTYHALRQQHPEWTAIRIKEEIGRLYLSQRSSFRTSNKRNASRGSSSSSKPTSSKRLSLKRSSSKKRSSITSSPASTPSATPSATRSSTSRSSARQSSQRSSTQSLKKPASTRKSTSRSSSSSRSAALKRSSKQSSKKRSTSGSSSRSSTPASMLSSSTPVSRKRRRMSGGSSSSMRGLQSKSTIIGRSGNSPMLRSPSARSSGSGSVGGGVGYGKNCCPHCKQRVTVILQK